MKGGETMDDSLKIPSAPVRENINKKTVTLEQVIQELNQTFHITKQYDNRLFFYEETLIPDINLLHEKLIEANYDSNIYDDAVVGRKLIVGLKK